MMEINRVKLNEINHYLQLMKIHFKLCIIVYVESCEGAREALSAMEDDWVWHAVS